MGCPQSKAEKSRSSKRYVPQDPLMTPDDQEKHVHVESRTTVATPLNDVKPSMVSTDVRDIEKEESTPVLRVKHIDFNVRQNTRAHHTDEFDITNSQHSPYQTESLVVRRGQSFELTLEFDRPYDRENDDLRIVFRFGQRPLSSRGTHVEIIPSSKLEPRRWGAYILSQNGTHLKLHVMTPPTCAVGRWELKIDVVDKGAEKATVYRYNDKGRIYALFNPWCKDDQVHMPETKLLQEYVLNETGKIYSGTYKRIQSRPWSFGQFTGYVLDCCMYILDKFTGYVLDCCIYILDKAKIPDHSRGNPVIVARKISALVNSLDDNGVVVAKWFGGYTGGKFPLDWTGSVDILHQYYRTKRPIKYGQCWVLAGVVTTVCRALGIPARCVTNFVSAHDTDGSLTADFHFDANGDHLHHMDNDAIWNFHVWNDVWMARPDLPSGYGGWQAIDATPQETSEGIYCLGPTSLLAIKRGEVDFPYDGRFVFSEVNADKIYWVVGRDGCLKLERIEKHSVGRLICTKKADNKLTWAEYNSGNYSDIENITGQYKYPEGSEEERVAVRNASLLLDVTGTGGHVPEKYSEDVKFKLHTNDDALIGDEIEIVLKASNHSNSSRTLSGRITLNSVYYTGVGHKSIGYLPIEDRVVESATSEKIRLSVKPEAYFPLLTEQCYCGIACMIGVKETKQTYTETDVINLRKPQLTIKAPESGTVGRPIQVEVSFLNPLPAILTNCELKIEGPGLQEPVTYKQPNVESSSIFISNFEMTPKKVGDREILASFTSNQLSDVRGARSIRIQ